MPGDDFSKATQWIHTASGRELHLWGKDPDQIQINDIAHALSHQCRFTGHLKEFYSVAHHCLLVSQILEYEFSASPSIQMEGLLHDAAEAYLSDIAAPFKRALGNYYEVEHMIFRRIARKFRIPTDHSPLVKEADWLALFMEAQMLLPGARLETWHGWDAYGERAALMMEEMFWISCVEPYSREALLSREAFLKRFHQLETERARRAA